MNKSYLKWAGGKSRILQEVLSVLPQRIDTFYEPFIGAGTVALNVNANHKVISDLNADLINCHKQVLHNTESVINLVNVLFSTGRGSYSTYRTKFNSRQSDDVMQAALFIYLNKHGFNGMCRYNRKGEFNIPVGSGKTVHNPIGDMRNFASLLADCDIGASSFDMPMSHAGKGDVIYCDPPYVPASVTLSEIQYTEEGFPLANQKKLVECAIEARDRGAFVAISNHDTEVTRDLYKDATGIVELQAFRSISSAKSTRGKVNELVAIYTPK